MKIEEYKSHEIFLERGVFEAMRDGERVCREEKLSDLKKWIDGVEKKRVRGPVIFRPGYSSKPYMEGEVTHPDITTGAEPMNFVRDVEKLNNFIPLCQSVGEVYGAKVREEVELMKLPRGAYDSIGRKRLESKCTLCGKRVWWCLKPLPGDPPQPYDGSGKAHIETCEHKPILNDPWNPLQDPHKAIEQFLLACAGKPIDRTRLSGKLERLKTPQRRG